MTEEDKVLCPKLAEEEITIRIDNLDSLKLSSYERTPGTKVIFSCLSRLSHVLNGTTRAATCLSTGEWDSEIPKCVAREPDDGGDGGGASTTQIPPTLTMDYEFLPYVAALAVLGIACIILIILLSYTLHTLQKSKRKSNSNTTYDSSGSSSNLDFWIESAGPRTYRCHELASSHDRMVHSLRYTNVHPPWSGY